MGDNVHSIAAGSPENLVGLAVAAAGRGEADLHTLLETLPAPIYVTDGDILIDVTDARQVAALRVQAMRCRRLAQSVSDQQAVDTLLLMAGEYDAKAQSLSHP